jgi:hypothetical protein
VSAFAAVAASPNMQQQILKRKIRIRISQYFMIATLARRKDF